MTARTPVAPAYGGRSRGRESVAREPGHDLLGDRDRGRSRGCRAAGAGAAASSASAGVGTSGSVFITFTSHSWRWASDHSRSRLVGLARSRSSPRLRPSRVSRSATSSTNETGSPASAYGAISPRTQSALSGSCRSHMSVKSNRVPEAAASSTIRWRNSLLSVLNAGVPKPKIRMSGSIVSWLRNSRKSVRSQTARPTVILPTAGGPKITTSSPCHGRPAGTSSRVDTGRRPS